MDERGDITHLMELAREVGEAAFDRSLEAVYQHLRATAHHRRER